MSRNPRTTAAAPRPIIAMSGLVGIVWNDQASTSTS